MRPLNGARLVQATALAHSAISLSIALDNVKPFVLTDSSRPGHKHLWIDIAITTEEYTRLCKALYKVGVLEWGFIAGMDRHSKIFEPEWGAFTCLRAPWVKKSTV